MAEGIAHHTIQFVCEKCGAKTEKTLGWAQQNARFVCPGCGHAVLFDERPLDLGEWEKSLQGAQRFLKPPRR